MHAHTTHEELRGDFHKVQRDEREREALAWTCCFPLLGNVWHPQCSASLYRKATEALIPPKVKAVLILQSLTNTEELVAETYRWEQLNAARGGTGSVGVFVAHSLVKATSGSGAKERGDVSWVCFLYKQDQILLPYRARETSYAEGEGAPSQAVTPKGCRGTVCVCVGGVCVQPTAPPSPEGQWVLYRALWPWSLAQDGLGFTLRGSRESASGVAHRDDTRQWRQRSGSGSQQQQTQTPFCSDRGGVAGAPSSARTGEGLPCSEMWLCGLSIQKWKLRRSIKWGRNHQLP